jgi:serine/threonine protein kinase
VDRLGQYRLLEELGRGGMGHVYKAVHTIMERVVAVKVILPELVENPLALDWFRREVRAATQLVHPNIVMAYDANEADGVHFLVMEYVDGTNLDVLVRREGPLPLPRACELMRQCALALQHAHEKGMVHRDVKPANVLIPREGTAGGPLVKLVDFGLARLHKQAAGGTIAVQTASGLLGTPDYIAPEQCRDIHAADIRSDLYSLGGTFYFVLTGRVPFDGESAMEKLVKHLMDEPEPVEGRRPDVPPAVAGIVRRLMAKKPEHRYQTPAELAEALAPWCEPKKGEAGARGGPPHFPPVGEPDTAVEGPTTRRPALGPTNCLKRVKVFTPEDAENAPTVVAPDRLGSHPIANLPPEGPAVIVASAAPPRPSADAECPTVVLGVAPAPAAEVAPPRIDPALRKGWRHWGRVVEALAERKAPGISGREYRALYVGLLEACRAHAAADEGPWRAFFAQAEEVVKPWLELHTLAHTEPELLRALARRCAEVAWELNGRRAPLNVARWAGVLLLAACVALFLLPWRLPQVALPASGTNWTKAASDYARTYWRHLEAHPTGWAVVAVPVVIGLSIFLITRNPRL